jgi:hypothetical protein
MKNTKINKFKGSNLLWNKNKDFTFFWFTKIKMILWIQNFHFSTLNSNLKNKIHFFFLLKNYF